MDANDPLKKIPSTAAKATSRWAKVELLSWIHLMAQSAFLRMQGTESSENLSNRDQGVRPRLTGVYGIKEIGSLLLLLDICINEERVCLGMNILHHDLETIEAASLGYLDLSTEPLHQVFIDDAVRRGKEGEHMGDEVSLIIVQPIVPISQILGEINFLGGPKGRFGLFVHLPDLEGNQSISPRAFTKAKKEEKKRLNA